MLRSALRVGSRLYAWKTNPTRSLRNSASCRSPSRVSSTSPSSTDPRVTLSSPARQCRSVDFPDPDGPMIAVNAPRANAMLTPRSAGTAAGPRPYTFTTSVATTAGGALTTVLVTGNSSGYSWVCAAGRDQAREEPRGRHRPAVAVWGALSDDAYGPDPTRVVRHRHPRRLQTPRMSRTYGRFRPPHERRDSAPQSRNRR